MFTPSLNLLVRSALLGTLMVSGAASAHDDRGTAWKSAGYDDRNTRYNDSEETLDPHNVGRLAVKWRLPTQGDVSATPAVDADNVYVPDFAGNLYAVDRDSGEVRWQVNIGDLTGIPGDNARATPAISGRLLIVGDQAGKVSSPDGWLLAIDKRSGTLVWKTKVGGGFPIMTQAAVVRGDVAYVGIASNEEALVRFGLPLTFRGSVLAVDVRTGKTRWQTYMTPPGYTGASVWGSTPAIDESRNALYIATGNNYSMPLEVSQCMQTAGSMPQRASACMDPTNYFDSIVSLDLTTGKVKWAHRAMTEDSWNLSCGIYFIPGLDTEVPGCPDDEGPDYDFAQGPTLLKVKGANGKPRDLVGAGQKSGMYWAVDASTGKLVWQTQAAPGGLAGGLQWGSASDGKRVYVASSDSEFKEWILKDGKSGGFRGGWSALDATTGRILWQTPNPAFERAMGPVSGANGVIYACSMDDKGHMYAMNAATGAVLWDFASGANCNGGAAIVDGMVFWGTGYDVFATAGGNAEQALYAFTLPKRKPWDWN